MCKIFKMCFEDSTKMECLEHKRFSNNKFELIDFHSLPSYLKDNEFILNYYRSEWPLTQTLLSIFSIHNETINIWTHLIGFFIFLALAICTELVDFNSNATMHASEVLPQVLADCISQTCHELNFTSQSNYSQMFPIANDVNAMLTQTSKNSITRWPLYAFMCGAMFCLFSSSACHLLSCHSKKYSSFMLRLDYTGISVLIVTSFYPLVYYSFMCHPMYRSLYMSFITLFGVSTVMLTLMPVFQTPRFRLVRSGLFVMMAMSGLVPIVHKVVVFGHVQQAILTTGYEVVMGTFYVVGVVIYVLRVPERWLPGKFDLAGHSHQLFHVMVILGACTHYFGGLVYLQWREMDGCY